MLPPTKSPLAPLYQRGEKNAWRVMRRHDRLNSPSGQSLFYASYRLIIIYRDICVNGTVPESPLAPLYPKRGYGLLVGRE